MAVNASRTLIIGPAWVGDMVMAQSLFKFLKTQYPNMIIDVLAPAWTLPVTHFMPEVNEAIPLDIKHGELKLRERYAIAKTIKAKQYDCAIVLPNSFKSALIPFLARIPHRVGFRRECRQLLLNDCRKLDKKRYPLMIEQYMALGLSLLQQPTNHAVTQLEKPYPVPTFTVTEAERLSALQKFGLGIDNAHSQLSILAVCPGAEFGPSKRWPENYYADIVAAKLKEGWSVWLFGSPKDRAITNTIIERLKAKNLSYDEINRCHNLAGRTTLADSIALLSIVSAVITNDSGLMHVAAALDKPVTALYGSTSPTFTPPLSNKAKVVKVDLDCQPCFERECPLKHHRCMQELTPDVVMLAMNNKSEN